MLNNHGLSNLNVGKMLTEQGVNPSHQRISILKFLLSAKTHLSVEDIYKGLHEDIPTLSKTTVYNTLSLLVAKKLISALTINETEVIYDYEVGSHAHFQCTKCKKIFDIDVNKDLLNIKNIDDHEIYETQINLKGICRNCL
ncbi:MAG: transcriptional repressor [Melioribacteraceae bacterium]|nr:transcriptional repressor [Melioribacteraceae bacterium]